MCYREHHLYPPAAVERRTGLLLGTLTTPKQLCDPLLPNSQLPLLDMPLTDLRLSYLGQFRVQALEEVAVIDEGSC